MLFVGKVSEQKKVRHLTNTDLAKITGYKRSTIDAFMCGARYSNAVAEALARALNIER